MERQLKERLVGAAVLIAVAVVMVPEMFSGSGSHDVQSQKAADAEASGSSESGQVKTYRIDLQQREASTASSTASLISSVQSIPSVPDTHADAIASTVPQPEPARGPSEQVAAPSSSTRSLSASSANQKSPASVSVSASHASSSAARATPSQPANSSEGSWNVQLGSFGSEATAKKIVSDARSHGFSAFHSPVKVGGKTLYRVRVGPYTDREVAQAALNKLKHSYAQASLVAPNH